MYSEQRILAIPADVNEDGHMARTLHPGQAELDRTLAEPLKAAYDGLEVIFTP